MDLQNYDILTHAENIARQELQRPEMVRLILETPILRAAFVKMLQDLAPFIREVAEWAGAHPEYRALGE